MGFKIKWILLAICFLISFLSYSQDTTGIFDIGQKEKYIQAINSKSNKFKRSIDRYTSRSVKRIISREQKLKRRVMKINPDLSKKLFNYSIDSLKSLKSAITNNSSPGHSAKKIDYFPYIDTLKQSLSFISKQDYSMSSTILDKEMPSSTLSGLETIEDKIYSIEKLQAYVKDRQILLRSHLSGMPGVTKSLNKMHKDAHYFSDQIKEYKNIFSDPSKIEKLVAHSLGEIPAFQHFMSQNSALSSLFPFAGYTPTPTGNIPVVSGIPSRLAIQQNMQNNLPGIASNLNQLVGQQLPSSESIADKIKNKINKKGSEDSEDLKTFKPNSQRTKPLWERIEFGSDIQFSKSSDLFPSTSDMAIKVAYKLNDKSIAGLGIAYKLGMGTGWNKIQFTHQGIGLRTYMDWKIKGGFYLQGGAELNHNNLFKEVEWINDQSFWQPSILLGLTKKYKLTKNAKGNMQVMYDFLHKQTVPNSQPIVVRFGYSLK